MGGFSSNPALQFPHKFAPTKIMFMPEKMNSGGRDLLITTSDWLRVFDLREEGVRDVAQLYNVRPCAPNSWD
jgi:hypothetical protein